MNEQNELSLAIRAKILPALEGKDGLIEELGDVQSQVMGKFRFAGSDAQKRQQLQGMLSDYNYKKNDIAADLASIFGGEGQLSIDDLRDAQRNLRRLGSYTDKTRTDMRKYIRDNFTELEADKMLPEIEKYFDVVNSKTREAISGAVDYRKEIDKANESVRGLLEQLKSSGYLALGGMAIDSALKYAQVTAQIGARQKTSFDLSSPMGMYNQQTQYELFRDTQERSMGYSMFGSLLGGLGGLALGGPWGAMGGAYIGGKIGGGLASYFNTEQTGDVQSDLKYKNQLFQIASQLVAQSRAYQIGRRDLSVRFGTNIDEGGHGFGLSNSDLLSYKEMFGSEYGRYNQELFNQQLAFARAYRINPKQIFQLNRISRMTGEDFEIPQLEQAMTTAREMFGEDAGNQRVIDVLLAQSEILKKMLVVGTETKDSVKYLDIPKMLMGEDSAYGRWGDLASETMTGFESLAQNQSPAYRALLMRAWGRKGLWGEKGYLMRKRRGIYDPENFIDLMDTIRDTSSGSPIFAQGVLENTSMSAPLIAELTKMFSGGRTSGGFSYEDFRRKFSETVSMDSQMSEQDLRALVGGVSDEARRNQTPFERANEEIVNRNLNSARSFESTILESQKKTSEFWSSLSEDANVHKTAISALKAAIDDFVVFLAKKGIAVGEPSATEINSAIAKTNTHVSAGDLNKYPAISHQLEGISQRLDLLITARMISPHNVDMH